MLRVFDIIKKNNISIGSLAKQINIGRTTMHDKLYGRCDFKIDELKQICEILQNKYTIEELLDIVED